MLNKVFLIGNLGRDPEFRNSSGTAVVTFSLATDRRWTDAEGQRMEVTDWHQIVCFGRLAEVASDYLRRGRQVHVKGRLQTRSWEDPETGQRRYRTEVVCTGFQMLGARPDADDVPANGSPAEATADPAGDGVSADPAGTAPASEDEDDDIPF